MLYYKYGVSILSDERKMYAWLGYYTHGCNDR